MAPVPTAAAPAPIRPSAKMIGLFKSGEMLAAGHAGRAARWDDQRMATRRRIALFTAVALAIGGCGGGGEDEFAGPRPAQHAERDAPDVIRAWADTLRRG